MTKKPPSPKLVMDFFAKNPSLAGMHVNRTFSLAIVLTAAGMQLSPLLAQTTGSMSTPGSAGVTPALPTIQVKADQVTGQVSPTLYGLMT
jgi:hypothetical protein